MKVTTPPATSHFNKSSLCSKSTIHLILGLKFSKSLTALRSSGMQTQHKRPDGGTVRLRCGLWKTDCSQNFMKQLLKTMCSCLWRYRKWILFCICTPFILFGSLIVYISLAVYLNFASTYSSNPSPPLPDFFIAKGASNFGDVAPYPLQPFWRKELINDAFWNIIQHAMDREHNPILRNRIVISERVPSTNHSKLHLQNVTWHLLDDVKLTPQMQRFILSIHHRDYPLLIDQPDLCTSKLSQKNGPFLLLAIKSQASNYQNREAIRQTWGFSGLVKGQVGKRKLVRRVFLLGQADPELQADIEQESQVYGDIIMWDFLDTFFNLTLKDVLFWDWFSKHCRNSRFVFKGDDDVFVRTPALLDYLERQTLKDFVTGDLITAALPVRSETTKYFIPDSFYKGMYPTYLGGGGVVYSGALVPKLLEVSRRVHLFPIDDVYLGMCLQRLGVIPIHNPAFLTFDFTEDEAKEPCAHHSILMVHKRNPEEMLNLWTEILRPGPKCKNMTLRNQTKL